MSHPSFGSDEDALHYFEASLRKEKDRIQIEVCKSVKRQHELVDLMLQVQRRIKEKEQMIQVR